MVLVTGGTGLVGAHLLYRLVSHGEKVRAIYRNENTLKRVAHVFSYFSKDADTLFKTINWVEADITNIPQLKNAFKNITQVYHCAALVSFDPSKYHLLRKTNIEGTANIVNLCISNAVKKLCYVSSIATIGHYEDSKKLINEQTTWNPEDDNSVYAITKYGAELEIWRGSQEGVSTVVINPGIILGAGYWHGGSSGHLFKQVYNGMRYYTHGVVGYVDVFDVVDAMILLTNTTTKNERFILVSENLSFKDFLHKTAKALDVTPPKKNAKAFLLSIAWRVDWLKHKLFRTQRRLSKHTANAALSIRKYDNSKIKNQLDFKFKPINQSIKEVCKLYLKDSSTTN